ncbi:hypothetical protein ACPF4P_003223 [Vibrio cholerae]
MLSIKNKRTYINERGVVIIFTALFFSILTYVIQFHVDILGYMGMSGLFIPDTLSMQSSIMRAVNFGIDGSYRTIIGVLYLYYPSYWLGHYYCYIVNMSMLWMSVFFFLKTLQVIKLPLSKQDLSIVLFSVFFNFYIIGAFLHPNKEIPLILLTNIFIYKLVSNSKLFSLLSIIFIVFLFRDAYAIILLATLFFIRTRFVFSLLCRNPLVIFIVIVVFISFFDLKYISSLGVLREYNYILERNSDISVGESSLVSLIPSQLRYFVKVWNNLFGSALRPQPLDLNGRLNFIGLGLWQFGVLLFFGSISLFGILCRKSNFDYLNIISIAFFICALFVSFGSLTQARYLMPYMFWLSMGTIHFFRKDILIILFFILLICVFFMYVLGFGMAVPLGIDIYHIDR